ncbi:hypothetical protein CRI94_15155 [Longibacter salinarum]|uniref:Big-1 domain-containing protein n=2 Tax=Longibacter salinarum TaxID=1850348 RepID=A0A2A8CU55_9BACT|nr:hypothetical protein CRI94_15155 [Longibacter salinarum]
MMYRSGRAHLLVLLLTCLIGIGTLSGCSLFDDDPATATISGQVVNDEGVPLSGVAVTAQFDDSQLRKFTGDDGRYTFEFEVDEAASVDVTVTVLVDGEPAGESVVTVTSDEPTKSNVNFTVSLDDGEGPVASEPSGPLSRLVLSGSPDPVIRVQESGGPETVSLTFVGVDSLGRSVDANNTATVRFRFGQNPGAGLEVNPTETQTNARGEVTAVVSSGTRSGVVQLIAEADVGGSIVRSDPVRITIHGGLPDNDHFTVGPVLRNIPGLVRSNETTDIEVIAGDQYGNPVVPGTAVYFTTDHGLIDGSTETDDQGLGDVILRSANPLPLDDGIVIVTAETADRDGNRVSGQTPVVFSGPTQVSVNPGTANFGSYSLTVLDPLGNPLVGGSSVSVSVQGEGAEVAGFTNTTIDDTGVTVTDSNGDGLLQSSEVSVITGSGITEFPFVVTRDPDSATQNVESITILVSSPNGNVEVKLFPSGTTFATVNGEPVNTEKRAGGVVHVTAEVVQ